MGGARSRREGGALRFVGAQATVRSTVALPPRARGAKKGRGGRLAWGESGESGACNNLTRQTPPPPPQLPAVQCEVQGSWPPGTRSSTASSLEPRASSRGVPLLPQRWAFAWQRGRRPGRPRPGAGRVSPVSARLCPQSPPRGGDSPHSTTSPPQELEESSLLLSPCRRAHRRCRWSWAGDITGPVMSPRCGLLLNEESSCHMT